MPRRSDCGAAEQDVHHGWEKQLGNDKLRKANDGSIDAIPSARLGHTRASYPTKPTRGQRLSKKRLAVKDYERHAASSQGPLGRRSEQKLGPIGERRRRDLSDPHRTVTAKHAARLSERPLGVRSTSLGRAIRDVVKDEWENDVVELTIREGHGSSGSRSSTDVI
jgi:hypothetical protein